MKAKNRKVAINFYPLNGPYLPPDDSEYVYLLGEQGRVEYGSINEALKCPDGRFTHWGWIAPKVQNKGN